MRHADADCVICNELGLHLRAAAAFVKIADRYESDITLSRDGDGVNGKSIIALVTLFAPKGATVRVSADGPDACEAVRALAELIDSGFGEHP